MKIIADMNVVIIGKEISISKYVSTCIEILRRKGLKTKIHALGTNIEGEIDQLLQAIGECHEKIHEMGANRILTSVKIASRTDRKQSIEEKIESVREKLNNKHI